MAETYKHIPLELTGEALRDKLSALIQDTATSQVDRAHAQIEFIDLGRHQASIGELERTNKILRSIASKNAYTSDGIRATFQIAGISLRKQLVRGYYIENLDMVPYQQILLGELRKTNNLVLDTMHSPGENRELVGVRTELTAALILLSRHPHAFIPLPAYARVDQSQAGESHLLGNKRADLMVIGTQLPKPVLVQVKTRWEDKYRFQYAPDIAVVTGTSHLHFGNDQGQDVVNRTLTSYQVGGQGEELDIMRRNIIDEVMEKADVVERVIDPLEIFAHYMSRSIQDGLID